MKCGLQVFNPQTCVCGIRQLLLLYDKIKTESHVHACLMASSLPPPGKAEGTYIAEGLPGGTCDGQSMVGARKGLSVASVGGNAPEHSTIQDLVLFPRNSLKCLKSLLPNWPACWLIKQPGDSLDPTASLRACLSGPPPSFIPV
jgi:hypothetical protein